MEQVEEFARSAHHARAAVENLRRAFGELADYPDSISAAMAQLSGAAATIARDARDWAAETNAEYALYDACEEMYREQHAREQSAPGAEDGVTQYVVISDMDQGAYGPFFKRENAFEYAEVVDGSVFLCVAAAENREEGGAQ